VGANPLLRIVVLSDCFIAKVINQKLKAKGGFCPNGCDLFFAVH
jgi:hypothetical protein